MGNGFMVHQKNIILHLTKRIFVMIIKRINLETFSRFVFVHQFATVVKIKYFNNSHSPSKGHRIDIIPKWQTTEHSNKKM